MKITDFEVGDLITVTKPRDIYAGPTWNEHDVNNMDYLTVGSHKIHQIGNYIYVYDERIKGCWSLDPSWCELAYVSKLNKANPHYKVLRKVEQLQRKRKEAGYAF